MQKLTFPWNAMGSRGWRSLFAAAALSACAFANLNGGAVVQAEEPYRQFLEKLRSEKLYDLALVYLDDLQKTKLLDEQSLVELPLERATLYQESAMALGPRSPGRTQRLDDAERVLKGFLETQKQHPRRSEARVGLGNLLLARAEEVKGDSDPKAANPEAARYYGEAEKLFDSAMKELEAMLKPMEGARISDDDQAKKALRDKLRGDYRQAELLAAYSAEQKGRSFAAGSAEWKKELERAHAAYKEFYEHEKQRQEARNYALYYRSGIQRDFGKIPEAVDGYMRIVGIDGIDELRPLQFKSLVELMRIWSTKEQEKLPAAIELATKWEKQIRPDERNSQDVIDFLLATAQARIDYSKELQGKDANDRNGVKLRKDARDALQKLSRINGAHQKQARALLAELGVAKDKPSGPVELPVVKSFEEANKEATARIEQMQTDGIAAQTLEQSIANAKDEAERKQLTEQLTALNESISTTKAQASQLLKMALRFFPQGGDVGELNDTRYRLAFVELQQDNAWEAIAIGEFLAHTNAGSDTGLQCATVALAGYGKLITASDSEQQKAITNQLQPFAEFMVATWPESSESQAAASTLVQLAMNAGDFKRAQAYLSKLPAGGSGKADKLRRDIGLVLAGQYFQEKSQVPDEEKPGQAILDKRDAAIEQLELATKNLKKDDVDSRTIEAINSLVRLYLAVGRVDDAAKWMSNKELAPVAIMRSNPDLVSERLVKLDSYRTALQATVSQLGSGTTGNNDVLKQIEGLIGELRTAAGSDTEGKQLLTAIFVKVAKDLQDLVEGAKTPAVRQKLADGMVLLCKQIAGSSTEFNTKFWAGQTLSKVAGALDNSAKQTKANLQRESALLMKDILEQEAKSPGWISTPNGDLLVRVTLAEGLRNAGEYEEAIEQIAKVLTKNEATLDMQIAAAEIYQAWGDSGALDKYDLAIRGALNNNKGGKLIWGWGRLSQALAKRKDLSEQFFHSRYNLAQCYMRHGMAAGAKKTELLGKAEREIGSTAYLYPEMGTPENYKRFDSLLKDIQKELGKESVGLAGLNKKQEGS